MMIALIVFISNISYAVMKVKADFVKMDHGCYTIHIVVTTTDQDGTIYVLWSGNVKVGDCPKTTLLNDETQHSKCNEMDIQEMHIMSDRVNGHCLFELVSNTEDLRLIKKEIEFITQNNN